MCGPGRGCRRARPWLQAGKYFGALVSGLPKRNGWTITEHAGDRSPDRTQRQYLGCAGNVANGINTVHLAYVRQGTGHALIGARQWVPRAQIEDAAKSLLMGLPPELGFRTKGQLAIDLAAGALVGAENLVHFMRPGGVR